jgi:hypothetical protein
MFDLMQYALIFYDFQLILAQMGGAPHPVRRFGPCTAALDALADWRLACGVPTVAMESTGGYGMPLFAL